MKLEDAIEVVNKGLSYNDRYNNSYLSDPVNKLMRAATTLASHIETLNTLKQEIREAKKNEII